jgi:hypothetical protein
MSVGQQGDDSADHSGAEEHLRKLVVVVVGSWLVGVLAEDAPWLYLLSACKNFAFHCVTDVAAVANM